MNKNELTEVRIEDFTKEGEGIGHVEGYTLFVKDAVIGDTVLAKITKAKKNYAYARMEKVLVPSPSRVPAKCPEARRCGGCRLQEYSYEAQLAWKRKYVQETLAKIGGLTDIPVRETIGMEDPFRYRNKAQYPLGIVKGEMAAGFYAGRTHSIIPVNDCLLTPQVYGEIVEATLGYMRHFRISTYDESHATGLMRHLLIRSAEATGEILVCPVINGEELPHAEEYVKCLRRTRGVSSICFNINRKEGNTILGRRTIPLYGDPFITDILDGLAFRISPGSFYQVNPGQTVKLYREAVMAAGLTGSETVFDLYCGIGTISLFMARSAKAVYGVEIVPGAVRDAKENAKRNGINNVFFYSGAAEDLITRGYLEEGAAMPHADVVVLDPPRKGCDAALIHAVLEMGPERVVYVSCDPATLARDLRIFSEGAHGRRYRAEYVQPVDMFGETCHIETVVLLSRNT